MPRKPRAELGPRPPERRNRFPVEIADQNGVHHVIDGLLKGNTLSRSCSNANVSQLAFWRRVLGIRGDAPGDLKRELAAALMNIAIDRSDQLSAGGNSAALSTFAKLAKDGAASLAPNDWGDKVQVENRTLIINTNLDFRVCETLEGIVQSTDEPTPDQTDGGIDLVSPADIG